MLRICKLGAFPEALTVVADRNRQPADQQSEQPTVVSRKGKPRRRARLHTDPLAPDAAELKDAAHFAADPERFAGLAAHWFWEDTLQIPAKTCWASDHAVEVPGNAGAISTKIHPGWPIHSSINGISCLKSTGLGRLAELRSR